EWVDLKIDDLNRSSNLVKYQLIDDNFSGNLKESLNYIVKMDDDITNAYVTTTYGLNMISGENIAKVDGRNREWYINALEKDINVTLPYVDMLTKNRVVTFSKVIKNIDGDVIAVVAIDYLLEDIISKYEKIFVKINGRIAMFDYDKNLIYKNELIDDEILNKYIERDEFDEKVVTIYNKGYLFTKDVEKLNIKFVFYIERSEYINSIIFINSDLIIKLLVGVIGLIFIIIYFSKYISAPVDKIEYEVKKFRDKFDLNDAIGKDVSDLELESESKDFDELLNSINDDELIKLIYLFVDYDKCLGKYIDELSELELDAENIQNKIEVVMVDIKDNQSRYVNQKNVLKVLDNKYGELVSTNMDMIFLTDRSGLITFVSKMFEDTLKYNEGELIGTNISELIDEIKNESNLFKIFLKRDFENIDLVLNIKNSEKKVSVSCSMQRVFEDSKILMIQGICRDVSGEKQMYYDYFTRNRELFIVNEISKIMTNNNNLDKILIDIAEKINILLDVSLCTIRILEVDELKLRAYSGSNTRLKFPQNPKLNDTHIGHALRNRQIMKIRGKEDLLFRDLMLEDALQTLN
ncbi:MAG: PAS domain-containing protein, partial [Acidaminobacteraceae bacterium]